MAILDICNALFPYLGNTTDSNNGKKSQTLLKKENSVDLAKEQQRLMEYLFKNYDINVRPVEDPSKNLSIRIVPALRQIVEIVSKVYQICHHKDYIRLLAVSLGLRHAMLRLSVCLQILDC